MIILLFCNEFERLAHCISLVFEPVYITNLNAQFRDCVVPDIFLIPFVSVPELVEFTFANEPWIQLQDLS